MPASLDLSFTAPEHLDHFGDTMVMPVFDDGLVKVESSRGLGIWALKQEIRDQIEFRDFKGKRGETMTLTLAPNSIGVKNVVVVGAGRRKGFDESAAVSLAGPLSKALATAKAKKVYINTDFAAGTEVSPEQFSATLANGLKLKSYRFDKYKTGVKDKDKPYPRHLVFEVGDKAVAEKFYAPLDAATSSELWAADLVNEPANILNPETYEHAILEEFASLPVKVTVLDASKMKELGMNAALAVGAGSAVPPRMVVLEYNGTDGGQKKPLALVGKGITFDNGGISIKSADNMGDMKMDMGGSAAMLGTMRSLALRGAKVNVVAIVALAENVISSTAYRPGDIYTTMKGKTVHIDNTDAEGRLVLADAMTYVQKEYKPHTMIDAATLTGAVVRALGTTYAGLFTHSGALARKFEKAGAQVDEPVWRLPLHANFANAMKDNRADLTNSAVSGAGGASKAAEFLFNFVEKRTKAVHLDIAGVAYGDDHIGNGFGVRLLDRVIANDFEMKGDAQSKPSEHARLNI